MAISGSTFCITNSASLHPLSYKNSNENNQIDRSLYLTFLKSLKSVHTECQLSLRNALHLDLNNQTYIDKQLQKPSLSIQKFLDKIRKHSINFLFAAEAVQRTKEETLQFAADKILDEWAFQYRNYFYNVKVQPYSSYQDALALFHNIIPKVADRIKNKADIHEAISWQPKLSEELIPSALKRIEKIGKRIFILASDSESIQSEDMSQPDLSISSFISNKPSRLFDILCYSHDFPGNYSFKKGQEKFIKNDDIINLLSFQKDITALDLSECTSLTNECLNQGHEKLKTLNLSYTYLDPLKIDPMKFPSLQEITCTARKKGLIFNSPPSKGDRVFLMRFNEDKKIELEQSLSNLDLSNSLLQKAPDSSSTITAGQKQNDNSEQT